MARITVDARRRVGVIDRNIYGHFIEHLGRCIYDGVWVGKGAAIPEEGGIRLDIVQALKDIKAPIIRWPGGNFASGYRWEDGVGAPETRPVRWNRPWSSVETNQFGTDEFIRLCRMASAAPYICVNTGSGNIDEACNWVEYCNGPSDLQYARMRASRGNYLPFGVKYWGIGNEIYGRWQIGHKDARAYADDAAEYSKAMKMVDQNIKTIAVGFDVPWNTEVLKRAAPYIDYIAVHFYCGSDDYYANVANSAVAEDKLRVAAETIDSVLAGSPERDRVKIAFDEWNIWYRSKAAEGLEEDYALKDAIFAAGVMNAMHRQCRWVTMANVAQLVNVIGILQTSGGKLLKTPIFRVFELYCQNAQEIAVDTYAACDSFQAQPHRGERVTAAPIEVPFLDASATVSESGDRLALAVVNRHVSEPISCAVELAGFRPAGEAKVYELNGEHPVAPVTFENPEAVRTSVSKTRVSGSKWDYSFPAHSVTLLLMDGEADPS